MNPTQQHILTLLSRGPANVRALAAEIGKSPKVARWHVSQLQDAGTVYVSTPSQGVKPALYALGPAKAKPVPTEFLRPIYIDGQMVRNAFEDWLFKEVA